MINYYSLHCFYAVAENLSISQAAKQLGVSQPALSMQVKSFEEQLGFDLFFRNGKSISLTVKGQELYQTAHRFYELNEDIELQIQKVKSGPVQKMLRIGVSEQVERPFVAEVVTSVIKRKKIKTSIISKTSEELEMLAFRNELDFLVSHEKLDLKWAHTVISYPVYFVTSKKTLTPTFDNIQNVNQLLNYFGEDLVIPTSELKLGKEMEKFRKKHNIRTPVILESNIVSCIVRSIADGLGCGFLPMPFMKSAFFEKHINSYGPKAGYWAHSIYIYGNLPPEDLIDHPLVKRFLNFRQEI